MSDIILTFQSQLSGVMETVFKAAIFEITRLVEDSFLEEVSRNREQVESLKKRLQWSETKRKDQEEGRRLKCADCGNARLPDGEGKQEKPSVQKADVENTDNLKQESWGSCGVEKENELSAEVESDDVSSPGKATESASEEGGKPNCMLKAEAVPTATVTEPQDDWRLNNEAEGSNSAGHSKIYTEHELQHIHDDWSSGLDQATHPEPEPDNVQGLPYRTRFNMEALGSYGNQELDMGELNGLTESPQRHGEVMGFGALPGSLQTDQSTSTESGRRIRSKRGNKSSSSLHSAPDAGDLNCLLINEEGYLHDISALPQTPGELVGDSSHRGHSMYSRDAVNDSSNCFYSGDALSHSMELNRSEHVEMAEREEKRSHTCSQCMMSFSDQASLKSHMASHRASASPYTCNQCGKKFTQACNLKVHQRIHQRDGLHLCNHCGKGYSSFSDLRKHRCSQAGDKPYSCSLCGNKFSRLWNLKLHRRIHTQEKPHQCSMCDKSFTRADILKVHQRTHTGERPYCCRVCGLSFKRLDHLRSHQRKHGSDLNNH